MKCTCKFVEDIVLRTGCKVHDIFYKKFPMYSDRYGYFFCCPHCYYQNVINPMKVVEDDRYGCQGCGRAIKICHEDIEAVYNTWKLFNIQ